MKCPKCGFPSCSISTKKEETGSNYSLPRAAAGELLFGPVGRAWGWTNKRDFHVLAYWVCKKCGHTFPAQ